MSAMPNHTILLGGESVAVHESAAANALADLADTIHTERTHARSGVCHGDNDGCEGGPTEAELATAEQSWAMVKADLGLLEAHEVADQGAMTLAEHLRTHAFEVTDPSVTAELRAMADRLDGGTGKDAHHGCPDPAIPSADCLECHMTLQAEVSGGGRRSLWATEDA